MFCPHCGSPLAEGAYFCSKCGKSVSSSVDNTDNNKSEKDIPDYKADSRRDRPEPEPAAEPDYDIPAERLPYVPNRSIVMCILLSIITCGIYGIYWNVCLVNDVNAASGHPHDTSGGMVVLLTLVTCGIYGLYWLYKCGEKIRDIHLRIGSAGDTNAGFVYLLLSIFGLGIVADCLIQDELNKYSAALTN